MAFIHESVLLTESFLSYWFGGNTLPMFAFFLLAFIWLLFFFEHLWFEADSDAHGALEKSSPTKSRPYIPWRKAVTLAAGRVQGFLYLVQGPALLQSRYIAVNLSILPSLLLEVLTRLSGEGRLVSNSDAIQQSLNDFLGESYSRSCCRSIATALAPRCRERGSSTCLHPRSGFRTECSILLAPSAKIYDVWL